MISKALFPASAAALAAALLIPALPAQAATGYTVSGTVVDAAGRPVVGVDVGLLWPGARPTASDDPAEAQDASDATGAFSFTVPTRTVAGGAWVWIGSPGAGSFVPSHGLRTAADESVRYSAVVIGRAGARATYWQQVPRLAQSEFAAGVVSRLAISVPRTASVSGHGSRLSGATVELQNQAGDVVSTAKAAEGTGDYRFDGLNAGVYRVRVDAVGRYLDARSGAMNVGAGAEIDYSPVLDVGGAARVRLFDGAEQQRMRTAVTLLHAGAVVAAGRTDRRGAAVFRGLPKGVYQVRTAGNARWAPSSARLVVRKLGVTTAVSMRLRATAALVGRVSAKKGAASVFVVSSSGAVVAAKKLPAGRSAFSFTGLPSGRFRLEVVRAGRLANTKVHLLAGVRSKVSARLSGPAPVLRGAMPRSVSGTVALSSGVSKWTATIRHGRYSFGRLPQAVYTATPVLVDRQPASTLLTLRRSTARSLPVRPLHGSVIGSLKAAGGALAGAKLSLTGPGGATATGTADGNGFFTVRGLVPGRWSVGRIEPVQPIAPFRLVANAAFDVEAGKQFQVGAVNADVQQ